MRVAIYLATVRDRKQYPLEAFAEGVRACGDDPVVSTGTGHIDADAGVIFGWPDKETPVRALPLEWHRRCIVIDGGILPPKGADEGQSDLYWWWKPYGMFRIGWRTPIDTYDYAIDFNTGPCRWDKLGYELKPWGKSTTLKYALVCSLSAPDQEYLGMTARDWAWGMVKALRQMGMPNARIAYRPHPEHAAEAPVPDGVIDARAGQFADWLQDASVVISPFGTHLVEAVIAGVPVYATHELSICRSVSYASLEEVLNKPHYPQPNRTTWAWSLAYAQWTIDEMKAGLPWRRLRTRFLA